MNISIDFVWRFGFNRMLRTFIHTKCGNFLINSFILHQSLQWIDENMSISPNYRFIISQLIESNILMSNSTHNFHEELIKFCTESIQRFSIWSEDQLNWIFVATFFWFLCEDSFSALFINVENIFNTFEIYWKCILMKLTF